MALETKKYQKLPVIIEAVQMPSLLPSAAERIEKIREIAIWIGLHQKISLSEHDAFDVSDIDPRFLHETEEGATAILPHFTPSGLTIRTLEGDMIASLGDYVARGIDGEFYPIKPDIFDRTYREVEDA